MSSVWPSSPALPHGPRAGVPALLVMLVLAGCGDSAGKGASDARTERPMAEGGTTVAQYCEKFARRYAEDPALTYQKESARVSKNWDFPLRFQNVFQPVDSRFARDFDCFSQAGREGSAMADISVVFVLTNTLAYAEHINGRTSKSSRSSTLTTGQTITRVTASSGTPEDRLGAVRPTRRR